VAAINRSVLIASSTTAQFNQLQTYSNAQIYFFYPNPKMLETKTSKKYFEFSNGLLNNPLWSTFHFLLGSVTFLNTVLQDQAESIRCF
jgi:hypothetical protein